LRIALNIVLYLPCWKMGFESEQNPAEPVNPLERWDGA